MLTMCFFFNDTATTEIYTLSLHDALPIWAGAPAAPAVAGGSGEVLPARRVRLGVLPVRRRAALRLCQDRKSTRLNSSHANISYAVFCLKKKKTTNVTVKSRPLISTNHLAQ